MNFKKYFLFSHLLLHLKKGERERERMSWGHLLLLFSLTLHFSGSVFNLIRSALFLGLILHGWRGGSYARSSSWWEGPAQPLEWILSSASVLTGSALLNSLVEVGCEMETQGGLAETTPEALLLSPRAIAIAQALRAPCISCLVMK